MSAEEPQRTWAQRAAAGDRISLTLLLAEVERPLVLRIARRIPPDLRPLVEAEDVVQEALAVAARTISRFTWRGPDSFYRWSATIAVRKLREWVRNHRALRRGGGRAAVGGSPKVCSDSYVQLLDEVASPGHTPSRSAARLEAASALHAALRKLPDEYRRVVELVYIEGRPVAAVAAELGRSDNAVHHLCRQARRRLRELLGDAGRFLSGGSRA